MKIRISKKSDVPLKDQIAEQIVFLIATGALKPGEALPSVRALSRQLKIHRNTVSAAYHNLAARSWVAQRRGSKVTVLKADSRARKSDLRKPDLDDLINTTITTARRHGYSLESLRDRMLTRLAAEPPEYILVVEQEPALRSLLMEEIKNELPVPVRGCSLNDLAASPSLAVGALVATPQYALSAVEPLTAKGRPPIPLSLGPVDDLAKQVADLRQPSVVAAVSASETVLRTARSLFAPAALLGHTLCEFLYPLKVGEDVSGADLVFCDALALPSIRHARRILYRAVAPEAMQQLTSAIRAYSKATLKSRSKPPKAAGRQR